MKAEELRIGNWVNLNDGSLKDDYRVVERVGRKNVEFIIKGCNKVMSSRPLSSVYGITLTEELLLKCGFEKDMYERHWIKGLCVHLGNNEFYVFYEQGRVFVKYLHQLQNLYYALTGKELEIKL